MITDPVTRRYGHLLLATLLALAACQQQSNPTAGASGASSKSVAKTATVATVGIAECDDYLDKYQACVANKVPESTRAAFKQSLNQTRVAWRRALDTPGGREGLAAACKQARDASKASLSAYGCTDF